MNQPSETRGDIPEAVIASVSDMPLYEGEADVPFWRPPWTEAVRHLGWRWVFVTPAVLLVALVPLAVVYAGLRDQFAYVGIKLVMFVAGIAAWMARYAIKQASRALAHPFCIHCGYNLTGLPDHYRCPECGRVYSWKLIAEYRRDPQWFIQRFYARRKLPEAGTGFEAGAVRRRRRARDGTE